MAYYYGNTTFAAIDFKHVILRVQRVRDEHNRKRKLDPKMRILPESEPMTPRARHAFWTHRSR